MKTTTTIFISCPENFTVKNKYKVIQCEKITMKNKAQSLEIAKANRAKWPSQAEKMQ